MHLLRTQAISLDESEAAVDLGQSPAELVILSFSDNDLGALAAAWDAAALSNIDLRLANLARLRHPFSVDTYLANVVAKARFVIVRVLGGLEYWRYGIDEFAAAARRHKFVFAAIPGDAREDPRLDAASTLPVDELRQIHAYFQHGGPDNLRNLFHWMSNRLDAPRDLQAPVRLPAAGLFETTAPAASELRGRALLLFYRATLLAGDVAPLRALAQALHRCGVATTSAYVTSLKDAETFAFIANLIATAKPDVILNTTGFSARLESGETILDTAGVPVLQIILAGSSEEHWRANRRGLTAADLAMNVALPEMDGRIITRAISCKSKAETHAGLEFDRIVHQPVPSRVDYVAALARAWVDLRHKPRGSRRIACILSNYPAKEGRTAYAVGLDTIASVVAIADSLAEAGYHIDAPVIGAHLIAELEGSAAIEILSFADYRAALTSLPISFVKSLFAAWGEPESDPQATATGFRMCLVRNGNFIVALQPNRGRAESRKGDYHDADLPPCHSYLAFYLWLRRKEKIDALIHCGTHGTLEWLPGKAVALTEDCAPEVVLGPLPVIYPFIVNNPGEAAQAKRRIAAVTLGHMTPPLTKAGAHGAALELEALFDEYAAAESLDPRRAKMLAQLILERAEASGLARDSGISSDLDREEALRRLDAWLCDIKDMRINDGLHVFGKPPAAELRDATLALLREADPHASEHDIARRLDACADAECRALINALDGCFVPPGPAGAPMRGRLDVLPTGRNLYTIDPRGVPTRTAWQIGRRTAYEVMTRYAQDHGEWPKRIIIDLWGSAMMRTGGDDLAQAFALMGVQPVWDHGSGRIGGFEILPSAALEWPRVDVTLRISGLFRDIFQTQIALFDEAVAALARLDEDAEINPLAHEFRQGGGLARIFGGAPGSYGMTLLRQRLDNGEFTRDALGEAYLAGSTHAYGAHSERQSAAAAFRERVATAQAFVHVQDMNLQDILDADAFAEHEGGFAAAAAELGARPAIYHVDATRQDQPRARTLAEEIARVVRGRAANPRWINGQMRHGHRGAAEIAETVDNLYAYAALSDAVANHHFDLMFAATLGDAKVRDFLISNNPAAARAIARRFQQALQRGYWRNLRNSIAAEIDETLERSA